MGRCLERTVRLSCSQTRPAVSSTHSCAGSRGKEQTKNISERLRSSANIWTDDDINFTNTVHNEILTSEITSRYAQQILEPCALLAMTQDFCSTVIRDRAVFNIEPLLPWLYIQFNRATPAPDACLKKMLTTCCVDTW